MKVSELKNWELNYWVAKVLGYEAEIVDRRCMVFLRMSAKEALKADSDDEHQFDSCFSHESVKAGWWVVYNPHDNWRSPDADWLSPKGRIQAGLHNSYKIIHRMAQAGELNLSFKDAEPHVSYLTHGRGAVAYSGCCLTQALLKCFVASQFGDEVPAI